MAKRSISVAPSTTGNVDVMSAFGGARVAEPVALVKPVTATVPVPAVVTPSADVLALQAQVAQLTAALAAKQATSGPGARLVGGEWSVVDGVLVIRVPLNVPGLHKSKGGEGTSAILAETMGIVNIREAAGQWREGMSVKVWRSPLS